METEFAISFIETNLNQLISIYRLKMKFMNKTKNNTVNVESLNPILIHSIKVYAA